LHDGEEGLHFKKASKNNIFPSLKAFSSVTGQAEEARKGKNYHWKGREKRLCRPKVMGERKGGGRKGPKSQENYTLLWREWINKVGGKKEGVSAGKGGKKWFYGEDPPLFHHRGCTHMKRVYQKETAKMCSMK